jgi:hypothetical protein
MKKMTGGSVPAMTWDRYMMVAEAGLEPADIAGLPVEQSHLDAFAELQRQAVAQAEIEAAPAEANAVDPNAATPTAVDPATGVAVIAPPPPEAATQAALEAPADDQAATDAGQASTRQEPDEAVSTVLQNVMDLFEQQPVQKSRQQVERRAAAPEPPPDTGVYRPSQRQNFRGRDFSTR